MAWFKKARKPMGSATAEKPSRVPEGLWVKCPGCSQILYNKDLEKNLSVCPKCAHHFRISAAERLRVLLDDGHWTEHDPNLVSNDPLRFTDTKRYRDRLRAMEDSTGMKDAVVVAAGRLDGIDVVVAAMEYAFIGGSMGVVVGEKIARAVELALERRQVGRDRAVLEGGGVEAAVAAALRAERDVDVEPQGLRRRRVVRQEGAGARYGM